MRIWWSLSLLLIIVVLVFSAAQPAQALPEYTERTGEPCSTCHINPAGGGSRTLRGLLWVAKGSPDQVPEVPIVTPPGPPEVVGKQLYKQLCSGCHGVAGEGVWAASLIAEPLRASRVRDRTSAGVGIMPAFGKRLTPEQLDAVVEYVMRLNTGKEPPPEKPTLLSPVKFGCSAVASTDDYFTRAWYSRCGGN